MRVLPSVTETTSATDTLKISGLNPFTCVAAQYPIPLASPQPVTRLGARFSSEVVANRSSGRTFTILDSMVFLGAPLVFFLYAISRSFLGILPIQMLEGAMWAAFSVVTPAFIADIARDGERGAYLGLYNQVWYIGWAIGPLFGGFLTDAFGFQSSFIICSLSLLLGLGLVLRLVRED